MYFTFLIAQFPWVRIWTQPSLWRRVFHEDTVKLSAGAAVSSRGLTGGSTLKLSHVVFDTRGPLQRGLLHGAPP